MSELKSSCLRSLEIKKRENDLIEQQKLSQQTMTSVNDKTDAIDQKSNNQENNSNQL